MLIDGATGTSRNKERDRCLLLLTYRHGFRVSEICALPLDHVDIEGRVLHVKRLKRGLSTTHPLRADEVKAIKAWLKERDRMKPQAAVKTLFISEQRKPLHRSTVNLLLKTASAAASLPFAAHPTCCAMPAASPSPIKVPIRGSFRITSATGRLSTPSNTPRPTRPGSKDCGGENLFVHFAPVRNVRDGHDLGGVVDCVNDPIIAYAYAPLIFVAA